MKWIGLTLLVLLVIGAVESLMKPGSGQSASRSVVVVRQGSFCTTHPATAYLYVQVTLRNRDTSPHSVQVRPWRRYSDGSVNDSAMDTFTVSVPGLSSKQAYAKYSYNAQSHMLIQCGVYLGDSGTVKPLPVR